MEKREAIEQFAAKRPESVSVYGYGSGVFKQSNTEGSKPLTDVPTQTDQEKVNNLLKDLL